MSLAPAPQRGGSLAWGRNGLGRQGLQDSNAAQALVRTGHPSMGMPKEPWAVVVTGEDGSVAAAASPSFAGGLFWAATPDGLLFGDNVREMVDALAPNVSLDERFIRAYATIPRDVPSTATAFREIYRVKPGTTAIWSPGSPSTPRTVEWCGPEAWGEPTVEGPGTLERYLATFDAGIDELLADGPIYTHMSGGLDSTFVAASLVRHATPDNPVHALCHSPLPEAQLTKQGNWDADDYPVAKAMEAAYPGRLIVHRVFAEPGAHPLDAAAAAAAARGVPTFNPGNQIWITRAAQIAAEAGAAQLFSGGNGNAAFSYAHDYAPGYYLRGGHPVTAWRSVDPDAHGLPRRAALRTRVRGPLVASARRHLPPAAVGWLEQNLRRDGGSRGATGSTSAPGTSKSSKSGYDYRELVGLGHLGPTPTLPPTDRAHYLSWLAGSGPLRAAGMFSGSPVPVVDAFTTASILDLAAAITPLEWSRGPGSRGYARLLGAGRVPDSIRLRTRRGGQSWDEWFIIHNDRDRYYDEVAALASTPILGGWVDDTALRAQLDMWPWGEIHGPDRLPVLAMGRILSLAGFVRAATQWTRG